MNDIVIPLRQTDTPRTDAIEAEALSDYGYCERSFNEMKEHAQDLERRLRIAQEIADDAAIATIECHGRRTDWDAPRERGYDIAGEPVEADAAYLEGRGLLRRTPMAPTLVILTERNEGRDAS